MTSPSPLLYDTYYHIYNRGVNGEDIFVEERNYHLFLNLVERHLIPVADLFAYCLLRNHFHLSVRTKSEEEILETKKTLTPIRGQLALQTVKRIGFDYTELCVIYATEHKYGRRSM